MEKLSTVSLPLQQDLTFFLMGSAPTAEKISAAQAALEGPDGKFWREQLGQWGARVVPVELLVPEVHKDWRPIVREAILFVVTRLAAHRLAPKIVEQLELGIGVPPEVRLLRFIAKVPGLQKIGQVLARNRQLHPRLRRALIKLENGISDVTIEEIRAIIQRNLSSQISRYAIRIEPKLLSEASVSAVLGFTWKNPVTQRREHGVFKVLKPFIADCYAEDMKILGQLAKHLARKHHLESAKLGSLAETLTEIRLLLEREVDFPREQETLLNELDEYRALSGVRIPHLIPALSTATITAQTFERGKKVTEVRTLPKKLRALLAEKLARTLLGVPALSLAGESIFHADPHAGNLLYDRRTKELVILDWALTERLTAKQRKSVLLLVLMTILRDPDGMVKAVEELCQVRKSKDDAQARNIRLEVERALDDLPLTSVAGPMLAMRLLDKVALQGVRFPAALLMFRKAAFTLEGVVEDAAGSAVRLDTLVANYALAQWTNTVAILFSQFSSREWAALEWSALTFSSRLFARALRRPLQWLPGFSSSADAA